MNREEAQAALYEGQTRIASNGWSNEAGVRWLEQWREYQQKHPYPQRACEQGPLWECPHWPNPVCLDRGSRKMTLRKAKQSVLIVWSCRVSERVPVGQMDLFKPHVSHKTIWRNPHWPLKFNEGVHPAWEWAVNCCKDKAADMVLYLQAIHTDATVWRVIPRTESMEWLYEQQTKNEGRIKSCIFDTV
jgi:hypothetical protein